MTQSISLTPSTLPLGLDPVWRGSLSSFEGPTVSGISLYRAQIWRRPQEVLDPDVDALATAYATVSSGKATFTFTPSQMDFMLVANNGAKDDVWLSIAGLKSDGNVQILRADWLTVLEPGCRTDDFLPVDASFSVTNSRLVIAFGGVTFSFAVEEVALPSGAVDGTYSVTNDQATFISDGKAWKAPVESTTSPSGLSDGGMLILNDILYIKYSNQAYKRPVAQD